MATKLVKRGPTSFQLQRLSDRQRLFIYEYLVDLKGPAAAIRAGYSKKGAAVAANKLLKHPLIKRALGKALGKSLERLELTREAVLEQLAYCCFRDVKDLCDKHGRIVIDDIGKLPKAIRASIDGIKCRRVTDHEGNVTDTIELKLVGKQGVLELAMKYLKLLGPLEVNLNAKKRIDWDSMYEPSGNGDENDPIEERLRLEEQKSE